MIGFIDSHWSGLLTSFQHPWLTADRLQAYTRAVADPGAPYDDMCGFIDGTIRGIRCPIETQREFYSGHKSVHCLKLQSICFPDGIIGHMLCHLKAGDRCRITTDCNILEQFHNLPYSTGGSYTIYGDSGYPLRPSLMVPYLGAHPTPDLQLHNRVMCSLRICVVWEFGQFQQFLPS